METTWNIVDSVTFDEFKNDPNYSRFTTNGLDFLEFNNLHLTNLRIKDNWYSYFNWLGEKTKIPELRSFISNFKKGDY